MGKVNKREYHIFMMIKTVWVCIQVNYKEKKIVNIKDFLGIFGKNMVL